MVQDITFCDGESFDSVPYIVVTRHLWCAYYCSWLPIGKILTMKSRQRSVLLYCGHSSFVMRLILHLTPYQQIIGDEVQQQVVIVYPSCIGITVITCQALLVIDSSGLVSNDARQYPWESAGVQPTSFSNIIILLPKTSTCLTSRSHNCHMVVVLISWRSVEPMLPTGAGSKL
jgi:hypothetical protein